jgi:uncharacterized SAM-binding protein YcdF (DUF218 family)
MTTIWKKRCRRWFVICAFTTLVALVALAFFPETFLKIQSPIINADVIVVPGGDSENRTRHAIQMFREKNAVKILLSGNGDCEWNKTELLRGGVPDSAILLECDSTSTKENAELSVSLLRAQGAKKVILATSWYHSRRALKTFQSFAPEIQFISLPVPRPLILGKNERRYVYMEYVKLLYYGLRWGISPV